MGDHKYWHGLESTPHGRDIVKAHMESWEIHEIDGVVVPVVKGPAGFPLLNNATAFEAMEKKMNEKYKVYAVSADIVDPHTLAFVVCEGDEGELRFPLIPPHDGEPGQILSTFCEVFRSRTDAWPKCQELNQRDAFEAMTAEQLSKFIYGSSFSGEILDSTKAFHKSLVESAMRAWLHDKENA